MAGQFMECLIHTHDGHNPETCGLLFGRRKRVNSRHVPQQSPQVKKLNIKTASAVTICDWANLCSPLFQLCLAMTLTYAWK